MEPSKRVEEEVSLNRDASSAPNTPPSTPPPLQGLSHSPVGVLLRNEEEGVMGGVTGGVRLPLL